MKKVLIAMPNYSKTCKAGYQLLADHGYEITQSPLQRDYTIEELKEIIAPYHGVIADAEKWNEETLSAAANLQAIARFGTGLDSIDLEAARRHGVIVSNCPGVNANAVAEHAVALLLSAIRQIPYLDREVRRVGWPRAMFHDLSAGTVGILGFGDIGKRVAEKLGGFGCQILAYDPIPYPEEAARLGVKLVSREEVLQKSDYITFHLPLLPETRGSFDKAFFQAIKNTAIVVNTARGPLVRDDDLYWALTHGELAAYACDVHGNEPTPPDHLLFQCPNYIATPHVAGETYEVHERMGLATANILIDVFEGRQPPNRQT